MRRVVFRLLPVIIRGIGVLSLVTSIGIGAAKAQQRKASQFTQAAQAINGPAGNPECVWLGRRVVGLMWNDDLDTAFRHLDLYDRFGCPGGHIQAAFRCLTRFVPNSKETDAF